MYIVYILSLAIINSFNLSFKASKCFSFTFLWYLATHTIVTTRLSKSLIVAAQRSPSYRGRGEERAEISPSNNSFWHYLSFFDPLMRIFLRRRNFHNFLVRRYFEKFCGAAFHLLYRDYVISLNSKHEITRVLRGLRHGDSIWENVMLSERKLAVRKTTTLDLREWRSSNLQQW